jgi:photosystem II stability/assembly factor-like uncharacterized protein
MKRRRLALALVVLSLTAVATAVVCVVEVSGFKQPKIASLPGFSEPAWAASPGQAPTIIEVDPSSAPNDLDTTIVVTGTGFVAVPTLTLGSTQIDKVGWVSSATLTATVPWGMDPGAYMLTVVNPGGGSGSLPDAFTVTQGIGVWTTGGPYGGWVVDLVMRPITLTIIYAQIGGSGLFASYDGAATWEMILLHDGQMRLAIDAQDAQVMYTQGGHGLIRTTDGGSTWEGILDSAQARPAAHPTLPGVVYAAIHSPNNPDPGNLFWSADYGSTWVTRTAGLTDTRVTTIVFHPQNPDKMLLGTQGGHAFLSTNGGQSWSWTAQLGSHVERVYFNPFGADEAWAVTNPPWGGSFPPPYLYKSTDPDLAVWTPITVTVNPETGDPVYSLSFISDTIWAAAGRAYTSTDGGASWSVVMEPELPSEHVTVVALDASNPGVMYAGHTGAGILKSNDGGGVWQEMNEGLAGVVPGALAVPPTELDTIYSLTGEQGLLRSNNGGYSWQALGIWKAGLLEPTLVAVDPFTPTRVYFGDDCRDVLCMRISEDRGTTWREVTATLPVTPSGLSCDMAVVVPHPTIPGRILAGVTFGPWDPPPGSWDLGSVYASNDYGEHWEYLGPTQPISRIVGIAYDAVNPGLVYAGTQVTGLWKSTNGGTTWEQVTTYPGAFHVASVAAHPYDADTVFVQSHGEYGSSSTLHVSHDAGETWEELPCDACGVLAFAKTQPATLYTGTGNWLGLRRSTDGGYTWEQVEGFPAANVYSLAAGTDGERVVVYAGIPGGLIVSITSTLTRDRAYSDVIPGRGSVLGGGIYRMTTRLGERRVYLPLVLRQSP